jgi:hypothetical protein
MAYRTRQWTFSFHELATGDRLDYLFEATEPDAPHPSATRGALVAMATPPFQRRRPRDLQAARQPAWQEHGPVTRLDWMDVPREVRAVLGYILAQGVGQDRAWFGLAVNDYWAERGAAVYVGAIVPNTIYV